jgi:rsbT antagonist protein RsbS
MERLPILKIGDLLLVSIQVDLTDQLVLTLEEDLAARIEGTGARGVLIDLTGLDMVDSFVGRVLGRIATMSSVLDAQTVVVGMSPAVAITLVELGMSLPNLRTGLDLEKGMSILRGLIDADFAPGGGEGGHGQRDPV